MSALNCTVSGASPSSGSASAHARRGGGPLSAPSSSPSARVVGGVPAAGAAAGAAATGAGGAAVFGVAGVPPPVPPPPPPHPESKRSRGATRVAEQARVCFIQRPPESKLAERRRILTEARKAVNCGRRCGWRAVGALAAVLLSVGSAPAARQGPALGELPLLAIRAAFPDRPLENPPTHVAGTPGALLDRLVEYYAEVSAGRLRIVPTLGSPAVTLPRPRAAYVQHPDALARDALIAFAAVADPTDREALARAQAVVVFFAGAGRESHTQSGATDDPWSNYTALVPPVVVGGGTFDEACVIAEDEVAPFSSFGVLCHEFGHLLGLPELYAPGGLPQEGIGVWGLMGQGTWIQRGEHPPQMCAWSKLRLGWVDVQTIESSAVGVTLPPVESVPRVIKIPAVAGRPGEYYLLENRARIGADRWLPGEGLLVWPVDESVGGFRSGESNVAHKLLHLVEADGRGDLDRGHAAGGNRGDAGDPWSGPSRWRRWLAAGFVLAAGLAVAAAVLRGVRPRPLRTVVMLLGVAGVLLGAARWLGASPVCGPHTPGMAPYDGTPGRVTLRNFSPAGGEMRFDVLFEPAPAPASPGHD